MGHRRSPAVLEATSLTYVMNRVRQQILPLTSLRLDPEHPRQNFELFDVTHPLVQSIREDGIESPLMVCDQEDDTYLIIDGNRRFRSAQELGFVSVPCQVYPRMSTAEIQTRRFMVNTTVRHWSRSEQNRDTIRLNEHDVAADPESVSQSGE